jgi:hypothetical protein
MIEKARRSKTRKTLSPEMLAEYHFDYRKARPNRFAEAANSGTHLLRVQRPIKKEKTG